MSSAAAKTFSFCVGDKLGGSLGKRGENEVGLAAASGEALPQPRISFLQVYWDAW